MLILTRYDGEGFTIGNDIEIKISTKSRAPVKIAIKAPKEILVLRNELKNKREKDIDEY